MLTMVAFMCNWWEFSALFFPFLIPWNFLFSKICRNSIRSSLLFKSPNCCMGFHILSKCLCSIRYSPCQISHKSNFSCFILNLSGIDLPWLITCIQILILISALCRRHYVMKAIICTINFYTFNVIPFELDFIVINSNISFKCS